MSQSDRPARCPALTPRRILITLLCFVAVFAAAWAAAQLLRLQLQGRGIYVDIPRFWPISIIRPRLPGFNAPWWPLSVAAGVLLIFHLLIRWKLQRASSSILSVLLVGLALVLSTNLIHGPTYGLVNPHTGDPSLPRQEKFQYYSVAMQITSVPQFLREFERMQPQHEGRNRQHPPGCALLIYGLARTLGSPAAISLAIAATAVGLGGVFLYKILAGEFNPDLARYVTLLLLLLPSTQIYYCATVDAIIAGLLLGVLLFFRYPHALVSIAGTITCLFCASFMSFGASFVLPVMVGFELIARRGLWKSAVVTLGVALIYFAIALGLGYNYLNSFWIASALENPHGFFLLADPLSYLTTRLECVAEIVLFFGPFPLVLFFGGMRIMRREPVARELWLFSVFGILTLLAMFLTGAFFTAETARSCLFIYPYLMFPVAAYLCQQGGPTGDKRTLLWLVFGQSVVMQTFAGYFW